MAPDHGSSAIPERRTASLELALGEVDPFRSLAFHRLGQNDRATERRRDRFDKVFRGPSGPARIVIETTAEGVARVELESVEADHDRLLHAVPGILGLEDGGHASFVVPPEADPRRVLRDARARVRGLRLVRVPWLYELLVLIVLQQRVAYPDAMQSHRWLLRHHGTPYSEGDPERLLFPSPLRLSRLAPEVFRQAGIDRERAERLRTVGRIARHLPRLAALPFDEVRATLRKVKGLGPWTLEHFLGAGLGDADAVPTGDYWYPHTVAYALAGLERSDDAHMLTLLEPFRPNRYRALLWLAAAGAKPVRHGPRMKKAGPPR
ncbi:MAG: hypothetical protein K1X94_35985 [Sandaracinaceae bacterium]|nr:hypothetical protein [Sandaracinaceae bacterium]